MKKIELLITPEEEKALKRYLVLKGVQIESKMGVLTEIDRLLLKIWGGLDDGK